MTDGKPSAAVDRASKAPASPTDPTERIVSLDALRGFALLGILVINMWYFSMPLAGAVLPPTYGDFTGMNYAAWVVGHVFFEMKFVTLFTLLFGAGIVLFTENKERKGQPAMLLHYRRTFWLLVIGLGHAYLLWYGDILVSYALCALIIVPARKWAPRTLLWVGLAMFAVPAALYLLMAGFLFGIGGEAIAAETEAQIELGFDATEEAIAAELETYRGSWTDQFDHRAGTAFDMQTIQFAFGNFWQLGGIMLIGMALFKRGILSNDRSRVFYWRVFLAGLAIGVPLTALGVIYKQSVDWSTLEVVLIGFQFTYWASLPLAGAYMAGVMLWCKGYTHGFITSALAAVGRTAFSNYLLQTVIATTVFYGHGLGLFGHISRADGLALVIAIWAIQIPLSMLWLRYFRFGPVEWVWRTVTYRSRQPLRHRT